MPGVPRVGFAAVPTVSRLPNDDEDAVLHNFALHASHCERCADPYRVHLAGKTLCDRGHQHARRVAKYLYNKGGRACSTFDLERQQPVQVEIPVGYEAVRGLLKAMERGLRLQRSSSFKAAAPPVVSYDRTYPVASRPPTRKARPQVEIVEPPARRDYGERVAYASDYGYQYHRPPMTRRPAYEEPIILYAAPRSSYQPRRNSYYDERFYR